MILLSIAGIIELLNKSVASLQEADQAYLSDKLKTLFGIFGQINVGSMKVHQTHEQTTESFSVTGKDPKNAC